MDPELLKRLYFEMLRIRLVEERIAELYSEQEMRCPVHLCIGQEAVAVGVSAHLGHDDYVMSGHRSHGHYLAKGGDLKAMLAELYGRVTGCCKGKGGSMHLVDRAVGFLGATPIVGSTVPITVGAAWAALVRGESRVCVVYFGEGATEEGVFHEALNFAALKHLRVLFVCENNLYSVYSPLAVRQPEGRSAVALARANGIPGYAGDGNDVLEVYGIAARALDEMRQSGEPCLVEFATYRWREHCGPNYDNDLGYRTVAEFEEWKARCPLERLRRYLLEREIAAPAELEHCAQRIEAELTEALAFARRSPFPEPELLMQHVFAS